MATHPRGPTSSWCSGTCLGETLEPTPALWDVLLTTHVTVDLTPLMGSRDLHKERLLCARLRSWVDLGDLGCMGLTSKRLFASWRAPRMLQYLETSSLKEKAA